MRAADWGAWRVDCGCSFTFHGASSSTAAESRRCTYQINTLRPSSHPGNWRPSICRIFARNLHSIDPAHAVYDAHPRRCTSHSMRRADSAKGSVRKCDRSKVAGCLGCELGLKELKPRQLYEQLLRHFYYWPLCLMVWKWVGCCRVKRWPSVATWEGWRHWRGEGCGWWLVSDRPHRATPPHATPLATPHVSIVNVELYSVNCRLLSFSSWNFLY